MASSFPLSARKPSCQDKLVNTGSKIFKALSLKQNLPTWEDMGSLGKSSRA